MAPANRAWIRSKMAAIKKTSGIAFSEEIFLSVLICLIAKNKHLVLHTTPEAVPELKTIVEQHSAVVFGLTTATIVCHGQQTRSDIIGAITGRHIDISSSTPSSQYQFPASSYAMGVHQNHHHHQHHHHSHHSGVGGSGGHQQGPSGQYYQYSNPTDEYTQRSAKLRFEKSRRSIATNHSGTSEYSFRPSEKNAAPSIASCRTASERDPDGTSIQRGGYHLHQEPSDYSRGGGDDSSRSLRRSESRSKSTGDAMTDHIFHGRARKSTVVSPLSPPNVTDFDNGSTHTRRGQQSMQTTTSHLGGGASLSSGQAPVTPVDFMFPRRRHESVSNAVGYGGGGGGETSGITYSGRRIAQAIILDGLENASQEVYAVLMEMIINKEINDRNRYVLPDLIIIAVFSSPNIPDNIPKQLLDYFAINGTYQFSIPQPRVQPVPARKHALFRRTEWDELSKRMKVVTVSNDMMRYIRDVIVAIRTHEAVHGGLTARAALDLEAITKTLAAIFQTTFVTPDLVTIAAEKVFSHRLELKSIRRRKIFAAASYSSPSTSSSSSPLPPLIQNNGKAPMRGYSEAQAHHQQPQQRHEKGRRGNAGSVQSSDGGASFVEISDSDEEQSSSGSIVINDDDGTPKGRRGSAALGQARAQEGHEEADMKMAELADEKTAADVVRDVLRLVYPPI